MALNKINLLYFYNQNNSDSYQLAQQYQNIHGLDNSQIIGLNCSQDQILQSYLQFQSQIQNSIVSAKNMYSQDVYAIVLGYKVPRGFVDQQDVISSTSRLSRLGHTYIKKQRNPLYNRKYFRLYNTQQTFQEYKDIQQAIICSHIDGKNKQTVKNTLYRTKELFNQKLVNGRLYIDNLSSQTGDEAALYIQQINSFINNYSKELNIPVCTLSNDNPYLYNNFNLLFQDSFAWLRNQANCSLDFFRSSNTSRVLFYNADKTSGNSIRKDQADQWMQSAIQKEYCCSAGAMSDPTIDGYLSPEVLFRNINNGATIGQSMLLSTKYLNWTISFFGDPLLSFIFPVSVQNDKYISNNASRFIDRQQQIKSIFQDASRLYAYNYFIKNTKENVAQQIANSNDIIASYDLILSSVDLQNQVSYNDYHLQSFINTLKDYIWLQVISDVRKQKNLSIEEMSNIDNYLNVYNIKVSHFIKQKLYVSDNNNIIQEGQWFFDYQIKHQSFDFQDYYFELQVSDDQNFSNIIISLSTYNDYSNWYYQQQLNGQYINFTNEYIGSNYSGLKVKYLSQPYQHLQSGKLYYFRIRQIGIETYQYTSYTDIIWS